MKYIKNKVRLYIDVIKEGKDGYIAFLKICPRISGFGKTKKRALKELNISYKCAKKACKDFKININGVYHGKKSD